jgi:uncharacterized 2Fe-2S/4Fe-4S cluster protein (DUF4445 family)
VPPISLPERIKWEGLTSSTTGPIKREKKGNVEFTLTVQPSDLRLVSSGEADLLTTLHEAGIQVESICGGEGTCGKCRIRVLEGEVTGPTAEEEELLSAEQLNRGERLACRTYPRSDLIIDVPASSLTPEQRLQLECELEVSGFEPAVRSYEVEVDIPTTPGDLDSDLQRVLNALGRLTPAVRARRTDMSGLRAMPSLLRRQGGEVRAVVRAGELLGITSRRRSPLGVAVDLGSTKVALFLYNLVDGSMVASRGFLNPQIHHGEDIVTRIQYAMAGGALRLRGVVVEGINENLWRMCAEIGSIPGDIFEMVVVGNTAMHHLFLELPVAQLGMSPYVPVTDLPMEIKARSLGLELNPAAVVYLPPPIAGYVGSDHLASVAAARLWERPEPCLLLDIGTNTEVALWSQGRIRSCSCASGPAFEGGGLSAGMRAGQGAIEQVFIDPATGEPALRVIGDSAPEGICGSGILGALASMVWTEVVDSSGRIQEGNPRVRRRGEELVYFLVLPDEKGGGGVAITQKDIREIQKAKGAIRAGVDALLTEAQIDYTDLKEVLLAGAFGTYIDPVDTLYISLLPPVSPDRVNQVGNAAGAGARSMLLSTTARREAGELAGRLEYLELSTYSNLSKLFAAGMYLSENAVEETKRRFKLK